MYIISDGDVQRHFWGLKLAIWYFWGVRNFWADFVGYIYIDFVRDFLNC